MSNEPSSNVVRNELGQIIRGRGNPNGWSRVHKIRKALNQAITTDKLRRILNELCRQAEGYIVYNDDGTVKQIVPGNIDAIREVLNRAYGKSTEHIEINQESHLVVSVRQMSDAELLERFQSKMIDVKPVHQVQIDIPKTATGAVGTHNASETP